MGEDTGIVAEVDGDGILASALYKTAVDDAAQHVHIYIAARHKTYHFLALYRHLVEHGRSHSHSAGTLGHKFLLLHHGQDCGGNLIVGDSDDVIDIFAAQLECMLARLFHSNAVGHGRYRGKCDTLAAGKRLHHARRTGGLHSVDLDIGID